jgi:glyoxylase-like metal-dependent hydrolase (beta-lactamase superfamily II)
VLIQNPPVQVGDGFWMLGTATHPFYLVAGSRGATIFEGGIGVTGPVLRGQLQQLGIDAGRVTQLVVTHAHPDHVMAIPFLRQICPEAAVLASEAAARTLGSEKAIEFFAKMDQALAGSLVRAGVISDQDRPGPLAENRIAVDRTVKEGDAIEVDDEVAFSVMETPGHSDCSLSFFESGRKVLVISDATGYYLPGCDRWWPNYFFDYAAYVRSMERLAGLGAEVVCLSHNAAIQGADEVADYFRRAIDATRQYHRRIVDEVKAGRSVREIAESLGAEVFEKTQLMPLDFFQKNCGLLVKVSLRHEGIPVEK